MFVRRVWPSSRGADDDLAPGRLLRDFERMLGALVRPSGAAGFDNAAGVFPAVNISRDDESFYVRAELPGVKADALDISAQRNKLMIAGRREIDAEAREVRHHRRERTAGSFSRVITLPGEFDGDRVEARYADGLLTVTLPVAEATKARQIKVKSD